LSHATWICGLIKRGVTLDFSRPGKPIDNAFIEAFNGRFREGAALRMSNKRLHYQRFCD
jgi:transposase InsO family protein